VVSISFARVGVANMFIIKHNTSKNAVLVLHNIITDLQTDHTAHLVRGN